MHEFLSEYAKGKVGGLRKALRSLVSLRDCGLHIKQLGFKEIPRPGVELDGVKA